MTQTTLYTSLRSKYQIGDEFIAAYLLKFFGTSELDEESYQQKLAENSNLGLWADYAFSTNHRGRAFAQSVRPLLPDQAGRYLDVGSAYGGFLIGFMELGLEVCGIEYNDDFVRMSHANFRDYNLQDASIQGDILDKSLLARLGKFDVITCIDVIEHVDDVIAALQNMVEMLNPGGILVLQMPNKDSLSNVIADPHFGLFGLTLLKHDQARSFYLAHFPKTSYYDVGEFYRQDEYLGWLTALGCEASAQPPMVPTNLRQKVLLLPALILKLRYFCFDRTAQLPNGLRLYTCLSALGYIGRFGLQLPLTLALRSRRPAFKVRYADDSWFLLGRKK